MTQKMIHNFICQKVATKTRKPSIIKLLIKLFKNDIREHDAISGK